MNVRELNALEIAARSKIVFSDGVWLVPAQTTNATYPVTLSSEPFCPCDDFELRRLPASTSSRPDSSVCAIMVARLQG
jgi:hypothetical protein